MDLLIGSDYCYLIPTVKEKVAKNLQLMESVFGMCVYGSHADIFTSSRFSSNLSTRINNVSSVIYDNEISVAHDIDFRKQINDFFHS